MLGEYTLIPARDAGAVILFMQRGRVLAAATAYDAEHAEVTARVLLRKLAPLFDSVILAPFHHGEESRTRHPGKEARREIKRAYKEGLIS